MWQTQSVWPVRTAHIRVLRTVNIVSHNPAQSCSDNIPSLPPDNHHNLEVVYQRGGVDESRHRDPYTNDKMGRQYPLPRERGVKGSVVSCPVGLRSKTIIVLSKRHWKPLVLLLISHLRIIAKQIDLAVMDFLRFQSGLKKYCWRSRGPIPQSPIAGDANGFTGQMSNFTKICAKINTVQNINILLFVRSLSLASLKLCS